MQGDDVRALQQLGKQRKTHAERVLGVAAEPGDVVILDAHAERLGEARHLLADVAKPDHELFTLKNAIFSPHGAGPTWDNHWKRWRNAFDNFERVSRGQKPFWVVPELRD